jgi:hypothetical protein
VVTTGKNVTAIFVTHRARRPLLRRSAVLDRFPNARIVATPGVMAHMAAPRGYTLVRRILEPRFPDQISD